MPGRNAYIRRNYNNEPGRLRMKWVIALFVALLSIPIAQVAADAWNDRPGPQFSVRRHAGSGPDLAITGHRHLRLYDPIAPWLAVPYRAKTG
jgi:hypothetical protein